jgi:hypothetical protein
LEERRVISFNVALKRSSGGEQSSSGHVVAVRVDGGHVLLVHHVHLIVYLIRLKQNKNYIQKAASGLRWFVVK